MNEPSQSIVFRGPAALCREYSLVLEARAIEHDLIPGHESWSLVVPAPLLATAYEELGRYALERQVRRPPPAYAQPFAGAIYGAAAYLVILLFVAYAAGIPLFGLDWYGIGAIDSSGEARGEWWRPLTALTLHVDPQHLLSNLMSGLLAGVAAARLVGPGVAWMGALLAAAVANGIEMLVSPPDHRAIGASTGVFALLGLITGLALAETVKSRERRWRRWAPVAAGAALLALTGGGGADLERGVLPQHVDVLGHLLGFACGTIAGWLIARLPPARASLSQLALGVGAALLIALSWLIGLRHG